MEEGRWWIFREAQRCLIGFYFWNREYHSMDSDQVKFDLPNTNLKSSNPAFLCNPLLKCIRKLL